ncbi:hypothetical protein [Stygiolobus caldivivus]|uniref:Thermopsin n=1 Tax=Stygiolobus caldivivus TaxID=2824673 RepID=A0A8D5U4S0_9CREN|nr:hypothetical protein [Stygiolobus caldivivus]BCU69037.1 hypothetical protein KN1_03340 [Stygiolobus caldivivus]
MKITVGNLNNRGLLLLFILFIIIPLSSTLYHASVINPVEIISNYPFYLNGNLVPPGKYQVTTPVVDLSFEPVLNATSSSRIYLMGVYINGTLINQSSFTFYTDLIGPTIVEPDYIQQYYVNVSSIVPAPISSGWYNKSEKITIPSNYYYQKGLTRYVLLESLVNRTIENSFVVNSPLNVVFLYKVEYYVNLTEPVFGYINGKYSLIQPNWYDFHTNITIPRYIYINNLTRLYTYGNFIGQISLSKPLIINDTQVTQYFIKVVKPISALVNGKNETLSSGWYNQSDKIYIPNVIPLINDYRIQIIGNVTGYNEIQSPLIIDDKEVLQYLITFPFKVTVKLSNGTVSSASIFWVDNGTDVNVPVQYYYFNNVSRALVFNQTFDKPNFNVLNYTKQYLIQVSLPIPAYINGENQTLTTGWYNKSLNIFIYKVYYITNNERIYMIKINTYNISDLNSPVNINDYYILEYMINITAYYGNTNTIIYNVKLWEPSNSTFQIPSVYEFDGTIFEISPKNSTTLYVIKPISEDVVYNPINQSVQINVITNNPDLLIAIILIVAVSIATILFIQRLKNNTTSK